MYNIHYSIRGKVFLTLHPSYLSVLVVYNRNKYQFCPDQNLLIYIYSNDILTFYYCSDYSYVTIKIIFFDILT